MPKRTALGKRGLATAIAAQLFSLALRGDGSPFARGADNDPPGIAARGQLRTSGNARPYTNYVLLRRSEIREL